MLSDDAHSNISLIVRAILLPSQSRNAFQQRNKQVGFIDRSFTDHHSRSSLQSHTGINIGFWQWSAPSLFILVILSEYQVPDLRKTTTLAIRGTGRFATTDLFPEVIVNLTTGSTGSRITCRTPEVILLTKSQYFFCRNTCFLPVAERLVIIKIDSCPQAFWCKPQPLGSKLPAPGNSFFLKIIADTKVTQHLKKGKMFMVTYLLNISGAKTLLACYQARVRWHLFTQEIRLKLHHAGAGEQQSRVTLRYKGRTGNNFMPFFLKEFQKGGPEFIAGHL
ncbi:hypothetical protein ES703_116504 [subsurface metagenome]